MTTATVAAALILVGPLAAFADEPESNAPVTITVDIDAGYTPGVPTEPSLAGTVVTGECVQGVPWIGYDVVRHDPEGVATTTAAELEITNGVERVTLDLGEFVDDRVSGRVLWPGTTVDASGAVTGWTGMVQNADGAWVATDGNYAWTRDDIRSVIRADAELAVLLSYPLSTPECLSLPLTDGDGSPAQLPLTGLDAAVMPIAIVGGIALLAGVGFLVMQRRRRV
ncbi:LPXTG cell wall anchor domain-containing protein [Microbacterium sp. NPDC055910]|uniref:LPXTG cell wall anchor domain-containing protein n=1 Tax=Microbacterium sp. NPDC055910 TaxID=3345659 RepID=UPI0035DAE9A7